MYLQSSIMSQISRKNSLGKVVFPFLVGNFMSGDGNWFFGRHFIIVYPIFNFSCCILVLLDYFISGPHFTAKFIRKVRPVGTNLVFVRRVRVNTSLSMKAERAKREERLTAWGPGGPPLEGPWRGPGAEPRRGSSAPGSSWVLAFVKGPERL